MTVTGTNFETTASKNKTKFNITHAVVSSATATSISTSVPLISGSGKVTVSTPNGAAISTDDFFVPPSPYTASDVAVTGRMTSGGSQTVNISTASKIGMILFEASAGQRAAVKVTSSSITSTNVSILNPNGSVAVLGTIGTNGGIVDTPTFTSSGTHTIVVDPNASYTGSLTFTLYVFNDVIGSITAGGSAVTVTTTTPGQNGRLNFSGTANQRVSLKVTNVNLTGGTYNWANVSIKKPDGSTLVSSTVGGSGFFDLQILPVTGTYTILVDPWDTSIGSATLTLYAVPADVSGTITPGGSAVTVTTTVAGQNAILTFSGTAGQRVSLQISNSTFAGCIGVYDTIKKPDGTNLAWTYLCGATGFIDIVTLPVTGTYTILIDPDGTNTGSQTLLLNDVPADVTGTITPGGAAVTVTTTTAGQNAVLTFSGTAGQRVSLQLSNSTFSGCLAVYDIIKNPDGTNLTWTYLCSATGYVDTVVLPVTGSYTILIDPQGTTTGSQTLLLNDVPADVAGTITPGGSAVTVTTTVPGQNGQLSFSGSANQRVSLQVSGVNLTGGTLNVANVFFKKPDGSTLVSFLVSGNEFFDTQVLPVAGTYVILVDPWDTVTGSLTMTLYDVPADATSTATVGGSAVTVTTTVPGQNAKVTFSGTAAQLIAVTFTNNSMGTVTAKLLKPDGSQLTSTTSNSSSFNFAIQTLPATGTYTVGMDSSGAATGSLTVSIQDASANLAFNKTATQSSTNWGAPADRAVDGNTDGNFGNNSVTHTAVESQAWWHVDLGSVQSIGNIDVWNRTDCCGSALTNFYVFVSDSPFSSTDLATTQNQSGVSGYQVTGQAGSPTTITASRTGRYVRVQLVGTDRLSLAEVQIWAAP